MPEEVGVTSQRMADADAQKMPSPIALPGDHRTPIPPSPYQRSETDPIANPHMPEGVGATSQRLTSMSVQVTVPTPPVTQLELQPAPTALTPKGVD